MSLMEKIRGGTESGAMRVVLGIIVVVFVFWGIGTGSMNTSQVVATVDGKRITDTRYHQAMKRNPRAHDKSLTEEQHRQVARDTIRQLITQEVLLQEAERLGIEISDEEVARTILGIEAFTDEDGEYSQELYIRHLKRYGSTQAGFEVDVRNQLLLSRLQDVALQAVTVDEAEIRERWFEQMTSFQLDLVTVRALSFYDDVQPSEAEVETFIAENRPEIRAWYDEHFESRFHKPPRAKARMILLRSGEEDGEDQALGERMNAIRAELEAGADFALMARKYSEDLSAESGGLLGEVRYDQLDTALGNAIFGQQDSPITETGLRAPARTSRGLHLVLVEELLAEETTEEQDARAEIAKVLMQERQAPAKAAAYAEQLRVAWNEAGELPLTLMAQQELRTEPVGPITLANPSVSSFGPIEGLRDALEDAQQGEVLDAVIEVPGAWLVVRVASREEPDPERLETELPALTPQIEAMRRMEFFETWVDDLVARADVKQFHSF
jgi:peptidyl-prolyl cis-trans isomerase D